jgi:hypothetical protein
MDLRGAQVEPGTVHREIGPRRRRQTEDTAVEGQGPFKVPRRDGNMMDGLNMHSLRLLKDPAAYRHSSLRQNSINKHE